MNALKKKTHSKCPTDNICHQQEIADNTYCNYWKQNKYKKNMY